MVCIGICMLDPRLDSICPYWIHGWFTWKQFVFLSSIHISDPASLFSSLSLSFSLHAWIYHYNCTFRLLAQFQCSSAPIYNNQHFSDYNCNINSCDLRDRSLRFIRYRRNFNYRSNFPFLNFSRSINLLFFLFSRTNIALHFSSFYCCNSIFSLFTIYCYRKPLFRYIFYYKDPFLSPPRGRVE